MSRSLILACGNTLRGDDGVGWWIAGRIEQYFSAPGVDVQFVRQFTPELAEPISAADLVVFVDCSTITAPGAVSVLPVHPIESMPRIFTHHLDPASVLGLASELYGRLPDRAYAVTVGGESFEMVEDLTEVVLAAIPTAVELIGRILRSEKSAAKNAYAPPKEKAVPARTPTSWPAARR